MIKSMTGYANGDRLTPWGVLSCEVRAVNSRHLELNVRSPDEIRYCEPIIRAKVQGSVQRGKVEVGLRLKRDEVSAATVNEQALDRYAELANQVHSKFPGFVTDFSRLLSLPGVLQSQELDAAGLQAEVVQLLDETLAEFVQSRIREGQKLVTVITQRIDGIERIATQAREWVPAIREAQRTRLLARLGEIAHSVDPTRLEQEMVIAQTKLDVDEELDRLDSHIVEARRILSLDEAVGRRLDFLMQEFNREANTLGSKSVDSKTSGAAVELKVLIDQVREQIQNLE